MLLLIKSWRTLCCCFLLAAGGTAPRSSATRAPPRRWPRTTPTTARSARLLAAGCWLPAVDCCRLLTAAAAAALSCALLRLPAACSLCQPGGHSHSAGGRSIPHPLVDRPHRWVCEGVAKATLPHAPGRGAGERALPDLQQPPAHMPSLSPCCRAQAAFSFHYSSFIAGQSFPAARSPRWCVAAGGRGWVAQHDVGLERASPARSPSPPAPHRRRSALPTTPLRSCCLPAAQVGVEAASDISELVLRVASEHHEAAAPGFVRVYHAGQRVAVDCELEARGGA